MFMFCFLPSGSFYICAAEEKLIWLWKKIFVLKPFDKLMVGQKKQLDGVTLGFGEIVKSNFHNIFRNWKPFGCYVGFCACKRSLRGQSPSQQELLQRIRLLKYLKHLLHSPVSNSVTSWHHTTSPCHIGIAVKVVVKPTFSWRDNGVDLRYDKQCWLRHVWADQSEKTAGLKETGALHYWAVWVFLMTKASKHILVVTQNTFNPLDKVAAEHSVGFRRLFVGVWWESRVFIKTSVWSLVKQHSHEELNMELITRLFVSRDTEQKMSNRCRNFWVSSLRCGRVFATSLQNPQPDGQKHALNTLTKNKNTLKINFKTSFTLSFKDKLKSFISNPVDPDFGQTPSQMNRQWLSGF